MLLRYIIIVCLLFVSRLCLADVIHTITSPDGNLVFRVLSSDREKEGVKLNKFVVY